MTIDQLLLLVQVAAVAATLLAVATALWLGRQDRQAGDRRADADRLAARQDAQRRFELDLLVRLLINLEAPGTSDNPAADRRVALGAERRGIAAAIGPDRLPIAWATLAKRTIEEVRELAATEPPGGDTVSRYNRASAEVVLELDRLRREVDGAGPGAASTR